MHTAAQPAQLLCEAGDPTPDRKEICGLNKLTKFSFMSDPHLHQELAVGLPQTTNWRQVSRHTTRSQTTYILSYIPRHRRRPTNRASKKILQSAPA